MAVWRLAATVWVASDLLVSPPFAPSPYPPQPFWNQIPVTALEAASLRYRGSKPDKGASRLTGRNFLRPHHTAWMCHDSRPTPPANLATISQTNSVNIRLYLLTNRRCLFNDSSSRQYHKFPHGVLSCSGTEDEDTFALPLYLSLELCYVLPLCYPCCFLFYRVAFFVLAFAVTWISKRSDLCLFLSTSAWGSMKGGGLRDRDCRVPKRIRRQVELLRRWRWRWLVFILPSLLPGPIDDLVIRVLMGRKGGDV